MTSPHQPPPSTPRLPPKHTLNPQQPGHPLPQPNPHINPLRPIRHPLQPHTRTPLTPRPPPLQIPPPAPALRPRLRHHPHPHRIHAPPASPPLIRQHRLHRPNHPCPTRPFPRGADLALHRHRLRGQLDDILRADAPRRGHEHSAAVDERERAHAVGADVGGRAVRGG